MDTERLGQLADELADRIAQGQPIDVGDYQARFPELADEIPGLVRSVQALCGESRALTHALKGALAAETPRPPSVLADSESDCDLPEAVPKGTELGDFRIECEIGRGGMGIVYAAKQISLHRRVALKVFPFLSVLEPRKLRRFQNEALTAASIDHPHIVPVYSVGFDKATHFYVMRLIEGCSLAELYRSVALPTRARRLTRIARSSTSRLASAPPSAPPPPPTPAPPPPPTPPRPDDRGESDAVVRLSVHTNGHASGESNQASAAKRSTMTSSVQEWRDWQRRLARWIRDAALALHHAHEMGMVHRDVKPSNLLVDHQQHCWLTDFGLAATSFGDHVTMTGDRLGTLPYMSPEQVSGDAPTLDHRTDIYSLGITLLEGLTGEKPFRHENQGELIRQIVLDEPRIPAAAREWVDRDLLNIAAKAIEKSADQRYATAEQMADDLTRYLDGKPVIARRRSAWTRTVKWVRRNRTVSLLGSITFVVLITATLLLAQFWFAARDAATTAQRLLYLSDIRLASDAMDKLNLVAARDLLARHIPQQNQRDLRGFAWWHLWHRAYPQQLTFRDHKVTVRVVDVLHDARHAVSADDSGLLFIWDVDTGRLVRRLGQESNSIGVMQVSPDGHVLAVGNDDGYIALYDLETGIRREGAVKHAGHVRSLAFAPDSSRLYTGGDDREVFVWSVPELQRVATFDTGHHKVRGIGISADGDKIVAAVGTREIRCWNLTQGQLVFELRDDNDIACLAASPTEDQFVYGQQFGVVSGVGLDGSVRWRTQVTTQQRVTQLRFSQNGQRLAVAGKERSAYLLDASTGQVIETFAGHAQRVFGVGLSADGRELITASADTTCKRFIVGRQRQREYLWRDEADHHGDTTAVGVSISNDASRTFASQAFGPSFVRSGVRQVPLQELTVDFFFANFSPDGRQLVTWGTPVLSQTLTQTHEQEHEQDEVPQSVMLCDVDLDGDLDRMAAIGRHGYGVWQETLADGRRGPIRAGQREARHRPSHQVIREGPWQGHIVPLPSHRGGLMIMPMDPARKSVRIPLGQGSFEIRLLDDLDGDGNSEVMYYRSGRGDVDDYFRWLTISRQGTPLTTPAVTEIPVADAHLVVAQDVDGDGLRDVIVARSIAGQVIWYPQRRLGEFAPPQVLVDGLDWPDLLATADVNRDGQLDLLTVSNKTLVWAAKQSGAGYATPRPVELPLESLPVMKPLGEIAIWDTANGRCLQVIDDIYPIVSTGALSPDGAWVAVGTYERAVRIYSVAEGRCVAALKLPPNSPLPTGMEFLPDNQHVAVCHGNECFVWNVGEQQPSRRFVGHENSVQWVHVLHQGRTLLTVSDDRTVRVWDVSSGQLRRTMFELDDRPSASCLTHDEETLAIATHAGTISLWDVESGQLLTQWHEPGGDTRAIAFTPNDEELVVMVPDETHRELALIRYAAPRQQVGDR